MSRYGDFFLATDEDLRRAFVGWKRPLPDRQERLITNPFTKQPVAVTCWVADPEDHHACEQLPGATLGQRLSHFANLSLRNLDPLLLGELLALFLGEPMWRERFAPQSDPPPLAPPDGDDVSGMLVELPEAFAIAITTSTDDDLRRVAREWADSEWSEWTSEDCEELLTDLRALAVRGVREKKRLYCWT